MEMQDALMILKQTFPTATEADAKGFLAMCADRGLSPFVEASPIITDYNKNNGEHVHTLSVKEHYAVQERWAQQCGGYTVSRTEVTPHEGGLLAKVWIISNRDYAAVGKLASQIPSLNFEKELARFEVCGESTLDSRTKNRRPPSTKTWEWVVTKRAREGALRQKFGKEPSQSRQLYANALTQAALQDAGNVLYPGSRPIAALVQDPSPVIETITKVEVETVEGEIVDDETPAEMTLEEAGAFTTPGGLSFDSLDLTQLGQYIEVCSKHKAGGTLTEEAAVKLQAAILLRDHLKS